jgi:hypothetical protein
MPADTNPEAAGARSRAASIQAWTNWLTTDLGGGPGPFKFNQVIPEWPAYRRSSRWLMPGVF